MCLNIVDAALTFILQRTSGCGFVGMHFDFKQPHKKESKGHINQRANFEFQIEKACELEMSHAVIQLFCRLYGTRYRIAKKGMSSKSISFNFGRKNGVIISRYQESVTRSVTFTAWLALFLKKIRCNGDSSSKSVPNSHML